MLLPTANATNPSLLIIECGTAAIATAVSFTWPRIANKAFARIEKLFGRLAHKQGWAVAAVGISVLLLRLAILPLFPIPIPFVPDDFSFLLASDTFVHGRLANPTPAMWIHFETIHVSMLPTYMSMYFPGQGLLLAAGKILFGDPWFGYFDFQRAHVRSHLLDAASVAAAELGAAGRLHRRPAHWRLQLLDRHLSRRRLSLRHGRSPDSWFFAAPYEDRRAFVTHFSSESPSPFLSSRGPTRAPCSVSLSRLYWAAG